MIAKDYDKVAVVSFGLLGDHKLPRVSRVLLTDSSSCSSISTWTLEQTRNFAPSRKRKFLSLSKRLLISPVSILCPGMTAGWFWLHSAGAWGARWSMVPFSSEQSGQRSSGDRLQVCANRVTPRSLAYFSSLGGKRIQIGREAEELRLKGTFIFDDQITQEHKTAISKNIVSSWKNIYLATCFPGKRFTTKTGFGTTTESRTLNCGPPAMEMELGTQTCRLKNWKIYSRRSVNCLPKKDKKPHSEVRDKSAAKRLRLASVAPFRNTLAETITVAV